MRDVGIALLQRTQDILMMAAGGDALLNSPGKTPDMRRLKILLKLSYLRFPSNQFSRHGRIFPLDDEQREIDIRGNLLGEVADFLLAEDRELDTTTREVACDHHKIT